MEWSVGAYKMKLVNHTNTVRSYSKFKINSSNINSGSFDAGGDVDKCQV